MLASVMLFAGGISTGMVLCLSVLTVLHLKNKRLICRPQGRGPVSENEADRSRQRKRRSAQWMRTLFSRSALILALILAYGLYASFAIAQATLQHIDPVVFAALQLSVCLPFALAILGWTMRAATRAPVRLGLLGGIPLGVGFVCIALSLQKLGIIPTGMLTALDGLMASLISWLVLRQPVSLYTFLAALCAGGGAVLLWWIAPSQWQTDLVALACGLLFTLYIFHAERHAIVQGSLRAQILPFFGGLFCSMSGTALALALCFGHWESLQTLRTTDLEVLLYCGIATVLVPQVVITILLRSLSAVTLAFCAILEPLISIGFAYWWGDLSLGLVGWCGVGLILLSLLLQANAGRASLVTPHHVSGAMEQDATLAPDQRDNVNSATPQNLLHAVLSHEGGTRLLRQGGSPDTREITLHSEGEAS